MKVFFRLLSLSLVLASVASAACSDDDPGTGWIKFDSPAMFLVWDQTRTTTFSSANIRSYTIEEKPSGWSEPVVDYQNKTVKITAPSKNDEQAVKSGSLVISGVTLDNKTVKATLFVSTCEQVDLSDKPANSFLLNKQNTNYLFDVMHKGDGKTALNTVRISILWQTKKDLVQYLELDEKEGKASFYIGTDTKKMGIDEGNALIGAYDDDDNLIWSWHIWSTNYDPAASDGTVDFNGYTMMTRNLGAMRNTNAGADDKQQKEYILESYGLYYQWGRKDPFIGPAAYNGSGTLTVYNALGSLSGITNQETNTERGTLKYANSNPWTFVNGVRESSYDWLWPGNPDYGQAPRWKETKTVDDPCPYGWQVAPAAAFAGLTIKEPLAGEGISSDLYAEKYGWTMTYGTAESLFMGAGRRIYTNSSIQNIYVNSLPAEAGVRAGALYDQPWIGLYWTADVAEDVIVPPAADDSGEGGETVIRERSKAFYFWFDKADPSKSGVEHAKAYERANGMQVRCVKVK